MQNFIIDSKLENDTYSIGTLGLCELRLMDDARFPWLILVPKRANVTEIIDLSQEEQTTLMHEISCTSVALKTVFSPDKLNVAALGNQVKQLHIHVIARFVSDESWPNPVWGMGQRAAYPHHMAGSLLDRIAKELMPAGLKVTLL